jgi:flagellar motor switch protein FliG
MSASGPAGGSGGGSHPLQGPDRVAAILLTMGKSVAARLMKHFEPDEIKLITRSVADLPPVPAAQLKALVEEFAVQFATGASLVGTASEVERLLKGVLPQDQIDEIMGDILGNADRSIWERISSINEATLAAYIGREHPQIAALILSKVKSACAARVISHLPADRRDGVFRRMLAVKPIVDEPLRLLERTLHQEFAGNFSRNSAAESQARIADIITKLEREQMEQVMHSLQATRPKAAESLKGMMFTFDDLTRLSQKARATLFGKVPGDRLVVALKGAAPEMREVILQSLSGRVRKMIEQELSSGQPLPQREVMEARRMITDMALDMANRREIDIGGRDDEAMVA